jgi:hypothetical protein
MGNKISDLQWQNIKNPKIDNQVKQVKQVVADQKSADFTPLPS